MDNNYKYGVGPAGNFIVFSGAGAAVVTLFTCAAGKVERAVGQTALLVILFGGMGVILIILMQLYRRWSKRTLITVGIVGWLLTFLVSFLRDRAFYQ